MKRLLLALILVALCSFPVWAKPEEPPQPLQQYIMRFPLVYQGECDVESLRVKGAPCLIFYDGEHEVIWLVLFNKKLETIRIIAVKNKEETTVWIRSDMTT